MLLTGQGFGTLPEAWHVKEDVSAGYCRVYYIKGGKITYTDPRQTRLLDIGRLYVFPSHAPYEICHDKDNPLCCLWYHFDLFPMISHKLIEFIPESTLTSVLNALIGEILKGHEHSGFYGNMVRALESYILEHGNISAPDPVMLKILHTIRTSYTSPHFSVEQLSAEFGYSTEHFIRTFKKSMNITPYQYVTGLRMTEAVRLLLEGLPVGQIAEALGYSESKVFSHAFLEHYGSSPSKFRSAYPANFNA